MSHSEISSEPFLERYASVYGWAEKAELRRWAVLAIIALGIAGVMALMIPALIAKGLSEHRAFFEKVLIVHVIFSFVVFFLCVFAAVQHMASVRFAGGTPKSEWLGYAAYRGSIVSFVFLFIPVFTDKGVPTLNNYVPVITDPMYYGALIVLSLSMALIAQRTLMNFLQRDRSVKMDALQAAALAGAVSYLAAFVWGMVAWFGLKAQQAVIGFQYNEDLFWASGHVLQFVNVAVLLAVWYALGKVAFHRAPTCPMFIKVASGVVAVGALASFALMPFELFGPEQTQGFTDLQYAHIVPTLPIAALIVWGMVRFAKRTGVTLPWSNPAFVALICSILVFGLGGFYGLSADGLDTRTPGHYHGIIAGLTVAFMGLFVTVVLPLLDRDTLSNKLKNWMLILFVSGQALAATGLFIAGSYGATRKTVGGNRDTLDPLGMFGLHLNNSAGLIAVIGGILFVWFVGRALMKSKPPQEPA